METKSKSAMEPLDKQMHSAETRVVEILDVISRPAAPFFEREVIRAVRQVVSPLLANSRVQLCSDRYGNLVLSFRNARSRILPTIVFASHMDHPGFQITAADGIQVQAKILGGLPRGEKLLQTKVRVYSAAGEFSGVVSELVESDEDAVRFTLSSEFRGDIPSAFAVPDVDRFRISAPFLHGRAMDDLAGCAIQLAVFERIVSQDVPVDCLAVFSRAEEVGFIGAQGICNQGIIPDNAIVVSLEASRNIPGARPENGVVIRTGDRLYIFDPNARELLEKSAEQCRSKQIRIQQQRMMGGVCEASLYQAHGYHTTAIAVPLINYHNNGENHVEAEAIAIYDINSAVELLSESATLLPDLKLVPKTRFIEDRKQKFNAALRQLLPELE